MVRLCLLVSLSYGLAFGTQSQAASVSSDLLHNVVIFDDGQSGVEIVDGPLASRTFSCANGESAVFRRLGNVVEVRDDAVIVSVFKCLPSSIHSREVKTSEMLEILRGIEAAIKVEADDRFKELAELEKTLASLNAEIAALKNAQ